MSLSQVLRSLFGRRRRIKPIQQRNPTECGPACLAMILSYHGRQTSLADCLEFCDAGRDGTTVLQLAEAARARGLRTRVYSSDLESFRHVELPAIVHWEFNHFLVVERWTPESIDVVDPTGGRRRITRAEFDKGFTGVVVTFEPGAKFERRSKGESFGWGRYLFELATSRGVKAAFLQILLVSLLLQGFGLALPAFTKIVVDEVLPAGFASVMPILGLGVLIWVAAQTLTQLLRALLVVYVQARLDVQMMLGFFEHMLSLPFAFFQKRTTGDLLIRLGSNAVLRELLTNQTVTALFDSVMIVTYLVLLTLLSPLFALFVVAIGALQLAVLLGTRTRFHSLMQRDLRAQADSQSYLVEALGGIAAVKAAGAEEHALDHWSNLFFRQLNVSIERSKLSALVQTALGALTTLSPLFLLWFGATLVLRGELQLGTMLALQALAVSALAPLSSLVSSGQSLQLIGAHLDRMADVLQAEPEEDAEKPHAVPRTIDRIELENVSFRYDSGGPDVLTEVSLTIEQGEKVALVGRTGSGKSTLAKLILGLHTPHAGRVLCAGRPMQEWSLRPLRRRFGVVLQEAFLFSGSIRRNIAFNNPSMTLEEVHRAARVAGIDEEIAAMPMQYETILTEGGEGLSGGQRQRLSIARAVAQEPSVLVLDEATSHLDALTEAQVAENLDALSCTVILIAHRLSTVRRADRIVVLDQGQILEQGTHEELLERRGWYALLIGEQVDPSQA